MDAALRGPDAPARAAPEARRRLPAPATLASFALIGVVAFAARLSLVLRDGGPLGYGAYDDGVHYAAANALVHGLLPYRDFLFLQPPGIVVALVPFALLGRVLGDPTALVALRVTFELVGALNAILVAANLRRFGLQAALVGGLLYAVFYPAVYDERTALLEPLGTTGVLVGLLCVGLVQDARLPPSWLSVAGAALGVATGLKIWYVASLVVILVFAGRGRRLRVLLGAVVAGAVLYLPFFVLAPAPSFTQIVLDQLGRGRGGAPVLGRLESVLGVDGAGPYSTVPGVSPSWAAIIGGTALLALVVVALRDRRAWPFVALLGTGVLVVLVAPFYFDHYAALPAAPLTLVVGVAAGRLLAPLRARPQRLVALVLILVAVLALNVRRASEHQDHSAPVAGLTAAAAKVSGCIYSDEPTLLAIMNVLTRDYDARCRVQPDMSGMSFDPAGRPAVRTKVPREQNPVYQRLALRYLRSGGAFIVVRKGARLIPATTAELAKNRPLYAHGTFVLRAGGAPR